ncbi:MAG: hypothetical protein RJB39_190 [Candidatus Parcubacteria bacterium]|jgi:signal transduction histidine kinase
MFSVITYQADRTNKVNRAWFYFSIPFGLWSFALFNITNTGDAHTALIWQYILDISAVWIPSTYFYFATCLLRYKKSITLNILFVSSALLTALSLTPLFKLGVARLFDFFWIVPGKLYVIFPAFFAVVVILSIGHIVVTLRKIDRGSSYGSQLKNTIVTCIIGFAAGGTNFFPQFFNIYPFGNYIVIVYVIVMVYGVVRHKLLSPKVVVAQLFTSALMLVSFVEIIFAGTTNQIIYKIIIFCVVTFFSWLFIRSVRKEIEIKDQLAIKEVQLTKNNAELARISAEKTEFVSLASHQIRGPLTSIKGYSSMILDGDFGPISPEAKEAAVVMIDSCNTLTRVVNDYLDITRIEQGRMKFEFSDVDLKALISTCIQELSPSITRAGLKCIVHMPEGPNAAGKEWWHIKGDAPKLKQVFLNLIDNSIKYTPTGSLTISLVETNQKMIRFSIKDTGVGIAPTTMPKLFAKFSRAENASETNILGTGLGLYVAKMMVEAFEGKVWAESEGTGKGSTFIVELREKKF